MNNMIYYKVRKSVLHDNDIRSLRYYNKYKYLDDIYETSSYNIDIFIHVKSLINDSVIRKFNRCE